MLSLLVAASLTGLLKSALLALLAVLNGILALLASVAVWKSYLVTGLKVGLTVILCIPLLGLLYYVIWGQQQVRGASS